jgi:putative thiamine transport system ATP-binding protein
MTTLALDRVRIAVGERVLVDDLSLVAPPRGISVVMGPSGSGKSTLLAYIGGWLDRAFTASGEIRLGGEALTRVKPERRRIGILFQDPLLFPHLSVGENLAFALPATITDPDERRGRVEAALAAAELPGCADRDPATLSGGQKARIALFRTLLSQPRALLLDEPFSSLDSDLRARMRHFVYDHVIKSGLPTLLVTHDEDDQMGAGGSVIRLGR